ncbi:GNAT family N-acetyltransferase [Psychroserpens damuponensis]|uniref:GNAT family N-acetyltransferase n=1 Tax=Psychroserpens damuponensis TaxID=943936 RepID=UPI00058D1F1E|nr:GNAT family N-acetyltransferase [Psychroserpens damuponensis]
MKTINSKIQIEPYQEKYREQLLAVWEASVLATHKFLKPSDFKAIKSIVKTIDFSVFGVFCLMDGNKLLGFIGVIDAKVEMLFISPKHFGLGYGKRLMRFAMSFLNANKVDVNEQNTSAVGFYKALGFETYERTEKDDQGKDYPLLRMKLRA